MRCAVKRFSAGCAHDPETVAAFNKEVFLLKNLNHENLVRFYAACTQPVSLAMGRRVIQTPLRIFCMGNRE